MITLSQAIFGTVKNDSLYDKKNQNGDNLIYGLNGNDTIYGYDGNDRLAGGAGNDTIYGGRGDDIINGGIGNDTLYGDDGDDIIYGGIGNDRIFGGMGNDYLNGADGNDKLYGQEGDDILDGGVGNDKLEGGEGSDTYIFGRGYRHDTIKDYDTNELSEDIIKFREDVALTDLWFTQKGKDLEISIIGTKDKLTVESWFTGKHWQVEKMQLTDGTVIENTQVQQLVSAMASFESRTATNDELKSMFNENHLGNLLITNNV